MQREPQVMVEFVQHFYFMCARSPSKPEPSRERLRPATLPRQQVSDCERK